MLTVPFDRLPASLSERHAVLRDYFCDKDAIAEADGRQWILTLQWPDGEARHVDPRLAEGLSWWGDAVSRPTMGLARRRSGRILTALYDTWTLLGWSEWLARHGQASNLTILHVDDHFDLAAPRLFLEHGSVCDAITGATVDFAKPETVIAAIESGSLGMGSFLSSFLYVVDNVQVRHLRQPPRTTETAEFVIERTTVLDTLLKPGASRPAIALSPQRGGNYVLTADTNVWLNSTSSGPVLLHIDMDYFNNRYDGDSDWASRTDVLDPTFNIQQQRIDELTHALSEANIGPRIVDVAIAYSPGFYPAEFWPAADKRLRNALEKLL
jgi:hypothetical protein